MNHVGTGAGPRVVAGPVVVGVDGSDISRVATAHGAWEAERRGVPLRLVHSQRLAVPYAAVGLPPDPAQLNREVADARALLADLQAQVRSIYPGLQVEVALVAGPASSALIEQSRRASVVVVGCRGLGGFSGLLLGSVSAQLAAHSRAPVIVIRPVTAKGDLDDGPADGPVVVGVDGAPDGEGALAFAFDQADARGVPLVVLFAWWMAPVASLSPQGRADYDLTDAEQDARRMIAEAVAGWRGEYPDVTVEFRPAHAVNPTLALVSASDDAGLLVVSRHGGNALTRLVLGSVGDAAVRHAACPVAIVAERSA